ncbi:MAG: hypothetical protein DCE87_13490 [Betaproteobacteria bacterium]|nr:MAG: hypothetical protein DCE87_13490 [Betaproteobacteria bacterium]PZO25221.1 MAG: hypothetical protein DCE89_04190 [Betaproteobacteria bacterium]PZO25527.1 MAG: hypothetical protein DCE88_13635 [Betaproteobacteria bacterium]
MICGATPYSWGAVWAVLLLIFRLVEPSVPI